MGRKKLTDEERKLRKKEYDAKWNKKHHEYYKKYNAEHKKEKAEYNAKWVAKNPDYYTEYCKTQMGRGIYLVNNYIREDKKYNRGECTLTAQWVVDNIFNKPCHYCGETDWLKIGCDRIDNSLPHTPDNVVPCCAECNRKRGTMGYEEFKKDKL